MGSDMGQAQVYTFQFAYNRVLMTQDKDDLEYIIRNIKKRI